MHKNVFFDFIVSLIDRTKHHVDYKNPDLTILLEISNDLLCFTIVEKYYLYRSYNLLSLSKSDEELRLEKEKLMFHQNAAQERKEREFLELSDENTKIHDNYNQNNLNENCNHENFDKNIEELNENEDNKNEINLSLNEEKVKTSKEVENSDSDIDII